MRLLTLAWDIWDNTRALFVALGLIHDVIGLLE